MFSTDRDAIYAGIRRIDPVAYGQSRNDVSGAVTRLSPYISRGLISCRHIATSLTERGFRPAAILPLLKELAWREYFQRVWQELGDKISEDIRQPQPDYRHRLISKSLIVANTGIHAIDKAVHDLYETGYLHNHLRMYIAGIACNIAKAHWLFPAQWMYFHLLDADWASNACSWQWVAGSFSNKKYYANQDNINRYTHGAQQHTFLDLEYAELKELAVPAPLMELTELSLPTILPENAPCRIDKNQPVYVYNFYNLDCDWDPSVKANRILLLEPCFFEKYPVSEKVLRFVLSLSHNIPGIQVFTGTFQELRALCRNQQIHYKEHPSNIGYTGEQHSREWLFPDVSGYFPSFSAYWKKCEKHLLDIR